MTGPVTTEFMKYVEYEDVASALENVEVEEIEDAILRQHAEVAKEAVQGLLDRLQELESEEPVANTVLQRSLHSLEDWIELVLDEAESYGAYVDDLRGLDEEDAGEIESTALDRIRYLGHRVEDECDSLLIWRKKE